MKRSMELKEIFKKINRYRITLILFAVLGLVAGVIFYVLPTNYYSSGSFFVKRKIDPSNDFFAYEGYYAQQSALSYTNSLTALAESPDVKKELLENMGEEVNNQNIRKINNAVKVKKTGPQMILITVKGKDYEISRDIWKKLANTLVQKSTEINKNGDENLSVSLVSQEPLVKEGYKNIYIFTLAGILLATSLGILVISVKEYFRN
ncbi:hypothetical protein K0B04_00235 [Patescibacteria group bacterium]|nr:hypothetical protein [Patescibacteria group bacterium]